MARWTFDIKFPRGTQFIFKSLTFAVGEDGDLKMLPPGPASEHPALSLSSTSVGSYSGLDPCARLYIRTAKLIRGIRVVTSILRSLAEALSSCSLALTPDHDSSDNYPKIGTNTCGELVEDV
jgi:hypothetical protein